MLIAKLSHPGQHDIYIKTEENKQKKKDNRKKQADRFKTERHNRLEREV